MLKIMTLIVIVIGITVCMLTLIKKEYIKTLVIAPVLIGLWVKMTEPAVEHLLDLHNTNISAIYPIVEFIEAAQIQNVYYLYDDTVDSYVNTCTGGIQYSI